MKYLLILGLLTVGCVRKEHKSTELTFAQTAAINSMKTEDRAIYDSCLGGSDSIRTQNYCLINVLEKK